MHSNSISKLLNLKEVTVKKLEQSNSMIKVYLETRPKEHFCPCCGLSTSKIHDYRTQKIKHFPINHKEVILILRKRRYVCTCGKRFYEEYSFLTKYMRTSKELLKYVCNEIRKQVSFSTVAMNCRLSLSTTIRYFNHINYPTEGFNNKIKVLKRISYGFRNFERFRNRILHCD